MPSYDPLHVYVEVFGDAIIDKKWIGIAERANNLFPVFGAIAQYWREIETEQFNTQGAQSGNPWGDILERTKQRKASAKPKALDPRILHASLTLRNSWTTKRNQGQDIVMTHEGTLIMDSRVEYGIYHQIGTPTLPVRKVVDFTEAQKVTTIAAVRHWIMEPGETTALAGAQSVNLGILMGMTSI